MIRWSYILTRLIIFVVIGSALWVMMNPLLRWGLIAAGQSAVGAKVEIKNVRSLMTRGRIDIHAIQVAHPDSPLKNLLEIEDASFDVEGISALKRRLIIKEGRLSGVVVHTDRETSGQLDGSVEPKPTGPSMTDRALDAGGQWIDGSLEKLEQTVEADLESIRLAKQLEERWPRAYERIERDAESLSQRGKVLVKQIEQYAAKPLDHVDKFQQTYVEVDRWHKDALQLKHELGQMKRQVDADRVAIRNAKQHDEAYIRDKLQLKSLDPQSLSEYLLGPEIHQRIATTLKWVQRGREYLPTKEAAPSSVPANRGIDVIFPSMRSVPSFLVRRLILDGGGTVNGKPYQFSGTIFDMTHQPSRHDKPMTMEIKSDGAVQMTAVAVLDRRSGQPTEHIVIDVPALVQHARSLGNPEKLGVAVSPGTAHIRADISLRGETVGGNITFHQDDVQLSPQLKQAESKNVLASNLGPAFGSVTNIQATVELGGTIKRPNWKLRSNLGPQLAQGVQMAFRSELAAREQQLVSKANLVVEKEVGQIEQKLVTRHQDILRKLELGDKELAFLKSQLASKVGAPGELIDKGKDLLKRFRR